MGTHEATVVPTGVTDRVDCTCGWKGRDYFDGMAWAEADWKEHKFLAGVVENVLDLAVDRGVKSPVLHHRIKLEDGSWLYCVEGADYRRDWIISTD